MLISYNWIKSFTDYKDKLTDFEIRNKFSWHSCEIDEVISEEKAFENMAVGQILKVSKHQDADSLQICEVDLGKEIGTHQIVCGGSNLSENMLVAVAMPGAKVKWHGEGELIELKKTKIRGEESFGMICASEEISMGQSQGKEIMDLSHLKLKPGTPLSQAFQKNDFILDIDNKTLTNRPDLWCAEGLARELATISRSQFNKLNPKAPKLPSKGQEVNLKVESKDFVKRFQTLIIENIEVKESPIEIQNLLIKSGLTPKNNIVDATNYVMYEIGQPMHAYDFENVQIDSQVNFTINTAKKGEKLTLLGDQEIELKENDNVLYVNNQAQMLLGIKGGLKSGVNENTNKIVLESAVFDGIATRKSSQNHHLRTDSLARYEKHLDPENTTRAIYRFIEIVKLTCPELKISGPMTDFYPNKFEEKEIKIELNKIHSYLGFEIEKDEILRILETLEFKIKDKKEYLLITPPSFRSTGDIEIYQDLIEEIARHYGYHNLKSKLKKHSKAGQNLNQRILEHKTRNFLANLGLNEVINYNFLNEDDIKATFLDVNTHLKLLNNLNNDHTHLRQTLLNNMLKNCELNHKNFSDVNIFEFGRTHAKTTEYFPTEEMKLGILVSTKENNFFKLKGIIENIIQELNIKGTRFEINQTPSPYFHPNKSACIKYQGKNLLAEIGIIHPSTQKYYNLDKQSEIAYAEINFGMLHNLNLEIKKYTQINNLPKLEFDLSIDVKDEVFNQEIISILKKSSKLITQINFVELYKGDNLEEGTKSMTYKISLQSDSRTLDSKDLEEVQKSCYKNLEKIGGKVRGS